MNFEETIYNAKIKYSWLGLDDDGVLSYQLGFECRGGTFNTAKTPLKNASDVRNILVTLDVKNWEALACKFARIKVVGRQVTEVGNIIDDRWYSI